jgi:amino acid transporter/nucleotide-binding universal stress UspA family protein
MSQPPVVTSNGHHPRLLPGLPPAPSPAGSPRPTPGGQRTVSNSRASGRLGPLLAWGVVFADIGTSIYYVPGLLFDELGGRTPSPAAAFVLATSLVFILLALKYVDVSARYPDGGGVVSVATDAFGPLVGCLGGMLICVDYFLTGAISAVTGFEYLGGLFPALEPWLVPCACAAIALLGVLNVVGIRESATLTALLAVASLAVNLVVVVVVAVQLDRAQWQLVLAQFGSVRTLGVTPVLAGFASSWLAFSGLESISQIAPALRDPRDRTALRAMLLVVAAILITSPLITAFETALLQTSQVKSARFLFELGALMGPTTLQIAIVLTGSTLLMGAANTAIIGCYHVFLALVRLGFLPGWLAGRSRRFSTPHRAILIAVVVPIAVVAVTSGHTKLLGDMYAFGLLGAFSLTSMGLDRIRWQEHKRGAVFLLGAVTSVLVVGSWLVNLVNKGLATAFGGGVTLLGLLIAVAVRRGWLGGRRAGIVTAEAAERGATHLPAAGEILTIEEALDMRSVYRSTTLVAMRAANPRLFEEAAARTRGTGEKAVYLLFVDEVPGLFFPPKTGPSTEAREVLAEAVRFFRDANLEAIPLWRMAHDAGSSIAGAARRLGVSAVLVGTSHRSAVWHLLRGNVLRSLVRDLPAQTRVWICN